MVVYTCPQSQILNRNCLEVNNMAKKKDKDYYRKKRPSILSSLKDETLHGVIAILAFVVAVITLLSRFGKAGPAGEHIYSSLSWFLGVGYYSFAFILRKIFLAFGLYI